ncbi:hypothetical protein FV222_00185 [Methylobacterium sp. WL103]|uniref:hypothetical protein n=1 Tax=Methylobacterium sp. WL103 TaxID=2603891 RepID=UPI0011C8279F|nr:hypothetical protein [Methylobacterium sp. WL103]TXN08924.1 hypothetical protein FV222_00185 [Methylobacterium sp. WL103]
MRKFVTSVVSRLADLIEFSDAALNAPNEVQKAHYAKIIDQEEKMEMRVARALGIEYRAYVEGRVELPFEEADREISRRRVERKRMAQQRKREMQEARELGQSAFA